MCGITGTVGSPLSLFQLRTTIRQACKKLHHRGPDEEGFFIEKRIAMGATRLAIRDPLNSSQPMTRQGMSLIFNGELYEVEVLKNTLKKFGYPFTTNSDTEVLLFAYIHYGLSMLDKLSGMFAFAIWDSRKRRLLVARDRWGEKPLYYAYNHGCLIFASELQGLKVWPNFSWTISSEDINAFLKYSYLPSPMTGWKDIHKLEQGSFLLWEADRLTKGRYYFPTALDVQKKEIVDPLEAAKQLYHLLSRSVKNCLVSDRPIGAFLSGGIDSTTIVTLLTQHCPGLPIFSIYWSDPAYSERKYIEEVVNVLNLKHYSTECTPLFLRENFEKIVSLYGEPFGDESMIPTFCLAKMAKGHVDVVLTGDGADEFFLGYERYFYEGEFLEYLDVFAAIPNAIKTLICEPDFLLNSSLKQDDIHLQYHTQPKQRLTNIRARSWVDIHTYLPDDILTKVDRATMGVALEARAPFLTPEVTNFALSCRTDQLIAKGNKGKAILRLAMKGYIPKRILERDKMGFGVPLKNWFATSLKDWMESRLFEGELLQSGWFTKQGLSALVANHLTGNVNYARPIFNLLVLEAWLRMQL